MAIMNDAQPSLLTRQLSSHNTGIMTDRFKILPATDIRGCRILPCRNFKRFMRELECDHCRLYEICSVPYEAAAMASK